MPYYAQITDGRVSAVTETGEVDSPNMIEIEEFDASLLGKLYSGGVFSDGPESRPRHITEGAFKDRLGFALVTGIAASTHPVCLGLREMVNNRNFIDLDRADLPVLLGQMVALSLPEAIPGIDGSGPLTSGKVTSVLTAEILEGERP